MGDYRFKNSLKRSYCRLSGASNLDVKVMLPKKAKVTTAIVGCLEDGFGKLVSSTSINHLFFSYYFFIYINAILLIFVLSIYAKL